jgi:gamma-glutamyltranspeptidase/glutathione hydrolase
MAELLSDRYTELRRPLIDPSRASMDRRPGDPRAMRPLRAPWGGGEGGARPKVPDTTTCVVADRFGNVIAATTSCNLVGNKPGPSGVVQGNRVRCLNTTPGHPNELQPGKRPRITLTPTLVLKDGKPVIAMSVAGGDLQDQTSLNVLLNALDFGMAPAEAVTAPRFSTSHHEDSFDPNPDRAKAFVRAGSLELQNEISGEVEKALAARGHRVARARSPIAHPVMLRIDPASGRIEAAGDPAANRHAAALE